ncbi:MAG: hypothetical protein EXR65_03920 [Dehalococcoidia bacterium]|nr:hypothetical protein [Dehalococcoidia bacterium]
MTLHLANGAALDLCHVPALEAAWFAAEVFRERGSGQEMDVVFVPHALVMRVTVSLWHRSQRPAWFELPPEAPGAVP